MAKIKRVLTDILFNQYIAEQLKPYIDRHDLELAHSLSIEQNSTGKVKVSLLNTKNEVLDSKYFNLPLEKFIKEVKLDYNNKCLVFIRNDETSFSCDISELINDYLNRINWLANAKQDTLISGSNIKTIGGISVLGSGNINVTNKQVAQINSSASHSVVTGNAVGSVQLTGSTVFNTNAYTASYDNTDECLSLDAASTAAISLNIAYAGKENINTYNLTEVECSKIESSSSK